MAKASDIIEWIARATGDEPRARSLGQLARRHALFTKTGARGRAAPEMTADDIAKGVLLALVSDSPSSAPARVEALLAAPLLIVGVDPDDGGGERDIAASDLERGGLPELPEGFEALPATAGDALRIVAAREALHRYDDIALIDHKQSTVVEISLHGARFAERGPWSEDGKPENMAWRFLFNLEDKAAPRRIKTERRMALCDLLDLKQIEGAK